MKYRSTAGGSREAGNIGALQEVEERQDMQEHYRGFKDGRIYMSTAGG